MKNPLAKKTRTVDVIVGGLTKMVTELEQTEIRRQDEAKEKQEEIDFLRTEQEFCYDEAHKAHSAAKKIRDLIS